MAETALDPTPANKVSYPRLDALRALCFLAVFTIHNFISTDPAMLEHPVIVLLRDHLFVSGGLGVNVFFVLSGFLITGLLLRERELTGRIHVPHFWLRRVLRIWPLYFFCVFFGFVLFPALKSLGGQVPHESAEPWFYLVFAGNFDVLLHGTPDATVLFMLWSVSVEEQFYAFWPLLLLVIGRRGAPFLFVAVMLFALVFGLVADDPGAVYLHTFSCISDLAMGALAAWWLTRTGQRERIAAWPAWTIVLIHVLFIVHFFTRVPMVLQGFHPAPMRLVTSSLAALIILTQSVWTGRACMLPTAGVLPYLGRISYGLYCLHPIGCLISMQAMRMAGLQSSLFAVIVLQTAIAFSVTVALAAASYRSFELPFLQLKERFAVVHRS